MVAVFAASPAAATAAVFAGEAAVKGQITLPRMEYNAQPVPGVPSSSNPRQATHLP